ncbi:MAG: mechanosensitive ion channel [Myxococcota bacterium]
MNDLLERARTWLTDLEWLDSELLGRILVALGIVLVGWLVARVVSNAVSRLTRRRLDVQGSLVTRLVVYYGLLAVFGVTALEQLGVDLTVLVGAAGVLSVAIGFAAQTSASNMISGLFLLGERPFVVGDIIEVEGEVGEVVGIDLLSVKLRTFDNLLVRVPNETLLKAKLKNLTHFPIRRFDLQLRVPYDEDLPRVRQVLLDVAAGYPLCLDEPTPLVWFGDFEENGARLQFSVWVARPNWVELINRVPDLVYEAFEEHDIAFAVPVRRVVTPDGP